MAMLPGDDLHVAKAVLAASEIPPIVRAAAAYARLGAIERDAMRRFLRDLLERQRPGASAHDLKHWVHAHTGEDSWGA